MFSKIDYIADHEGGSLPKPGKKSYVFVRLIIPHHQGIALFIPLQVVLDLLALNHVSAETSPASPHLITGDFYIFSYILYF